MSGCTNEVACNYDALATEDDGSCDCSCAGGDADEDGVCDDFEVVGCDNMLACNYNELATEDDGSCDFCSCAGEEVPFPLVVEANPAVAVEGATVYRFYVQMTEPADRMSAVFGNVSDTLMVSTPSGAFNSSLNASWNASGINPLIVGS